MTAGTVVIGAGIGGLTAAIDLALAGHTVTLLERHDEPGGKMRQLEVDGVGIDAGPTVFTMRWIFEDLFRAAGRSIDATLDLTSASILARHAWADGGTLDLHADIVRSADAIREFSGAADAAGYLAFCARSEDIFRTLKDSFIAAQKPNPLSLAYRVGLSRIDALLRTAPFRSLWQALDGFFEDPRLRQLFARYSTYVGSSPLHTPATLMLIAHVEQDGVWLVRGGMRAVAEALLQLARDLGVDCRLGCGADSIDVESGRVRSVTTEAGETIPADGVIFNGDTNALASGLLGDGVRSAVPETPRTRRALAAVTWCIHGETRGFELDYHNVFFAENYAEEFRAIFDRREITQRPTVYICAQDRVGGHRPRGRERLLLLINAPADGDREPLAEPLVDALRERTLALLHECGLDISYAPGACLATTPSDFNARFPATGGSLYGKATHGMFASFARPGARSGVRGLYLAGGSVHPGPGVPMAAMSGRLAAAALGEDLPTHS